MKHKISAIICAAGKGERANLGKNKLLAPLYGAPVLFHTFKKFDIDCIDEVIVTAAKDDFKEICALAKPFGYKVVYGGKTRTESVKNALKAVTGDIVLIHDGARPYVTEKLIKDCISSVEKFSSGVCAVKFTDTAAVVNYGEICDVPDRESLYRLQTPQAFFTEDIIRAYTLAGNKTYTDDSAVFAEFIAPPRIVEGDEDNVKITYKKDFPREYARFTASENQKVGFGVDVHAFGEGTHITLGGVKIECGKSLIAHSDGDVIYHAVIDALLSAAGLEDIGHYFPDSDLMYRGADSGKLLEKTVETVKTAGYSVGNVSVSVQAESPRLAPNIEKMRKNIADICGIKVEDCAVAAGTCEHLGFVGEGLGICAYCVATLIKNS